MNRIITISLPLLISLNLSSAFADQWCWTSNENNTFGWQLMTPDERKEYQAMLVRFSEYDGCKEYVYEHLKKMAERARGKGVDLPPVSINPCAAMRARGVLK